MPELPEVETVCRGLHRRIVGETVKSVDVLRVDSIGYPAPAQFAKKMIGHTFRSVGRRGKYILAQLDGGAGFACHLRMSGRLLFVDKKRPADRFLRVRIKFESGNELHFEDMRVFGRLWYVPPKKTFEEVIPTLAELGLEPLEGLSGQHLKEVFAGRRGPIKNALLDQSVIAGVGNIYADESLFLSNIHPLRRACDLKRKELDKLVDVIRTVLERAIELGGSTLRDYASAEGVNGNYQHDSWVYGRTAKECRVCKTPIERVKIGGRSSHFCTKCQPRSKR